MLNLVNKCPISYLTVIVDRREVIDKIDLSGKLAKAINRALSEHIEFFRIMTGLLFTMIMDRLNLVQF